MPDNTSYSVEQHFPSPVKQPKALQDVLTFWYPLPSTENTKIENDGSIVESTACTRRPNYLNDMSYVNSHVPGWMMGGQVMDEKCQYFRELIRSVAASSSANNSNNSDNQKPTSSASLLDDYVAKIILFDQISRNAFRYEPEAYAYDEMVVQILNKLFQIQQEADNDETSEMISDDTLFELVNGENITICDCFFIAIACQHQEKKVFRGVDSQLYHKMEERWPLCKNFIKEASFHADSHSQVLNKFGRYPHRNPHKGREHTKEEIEWLKDYDNLPPWVKSQLPKNF